MPGRASDSKEEMKKKRCQIPSALLATSKPLSWREVRARQKLVLKAKVQNKEDGLVDSYEEAFAATPLQPLMPLVADLQLHRPKIASAALLGISADGPLCTWADAEDFALIARRVHKGEIEAQPEAQKALNIEKEKLERVPVWDWRHPVSWRQVSAEAQKVGTKAYIGDIMPLVYEKHS